jgi:hypothetical protein
MCAVNPVRVNCSFDDLDPRVVATLQPWAAISERLRRISNQLHLAGEFGGGLWAVVGIFGEGVHDSQ